MLIVWNKEGGRDGKFSEKSRYRSWKGLVDWPVVEVIGKWVIYQGWLPSGLSNWTDDSYHLVIWKILEEK